METYSRTNSRPPRLGGDLVVAKKAKLMDTSTHSLAMELKRLSRPHGPSPPKGCIFLGPFPMAKGQVKFLLVTAHYFTKWDKSSSY
ncbi:hypothetical protein CR513_31593, partial [Mucuna pruriens]